LKVEMRHRGRFGEVGGTSFRMGRVGIHPR
jgi:hypothetical protein